jgi:hypothetical protein
VYPKSRSSSLPPQASDTDIRYNPDVTAKARLLKVADELLVEGQGVLESESELPYISVKIVDAQKMAKWEAGLRHLLHLIGAHAAAWTQTLERPTWEDGPTYAKRLLGTLEAVRQVIDQDLLLTVEHLVMAEAFADLLEQADYLLRGGYFIAAGVLGRAVLEEHLRKWGQHAGCVYTKHDGTPNTKPTMADFYGELTKGGQLSKLERKNVEDMAGIGNDCAHNKGTATKADVERLLRDVREFLVRHPLT